MVRKKVVYVAGPYTKPDPGANVNTAILYADALLDRGVVPLVPHLTHLWHLVSPKPYEAWLSIDFDYLLRCDALVRMPGESPGADREVLFALANKIKVFEIDPDENITRQLDLLVKELEKE